LVSISWAHLSDTANRAETRRIEQQKARLQRELKDLEKQRGAKESEIMNINREVRGLQDKIGEQRSLREYVSKAL
jgi:predicted  nucleic acid-binding Zn-ribbon protein